MRIRILFVWFGLGWARLPVVAQAVLSGQITDPEQHALSGINVTVHPLRGEAIIAFDITDEGGNFAVMLKGDQDSIRLRAYGLGWAAQGKRLANRSQVVDIRLFSQPIALREVKVKPPLISQQHDTISYSVDAFKNRSDRVIADVIKKLPGIEVETDGRILYQGKPINKYYIQGMNLLENKYRLANDNLPADAVAEVQVIENHQPIRMLDSLVFSDRAALNIKLKKNVTTTGTAHIGLGWHPLLWDANLTPMLFSQNSQAIVSYQANNTGANVARQLKNLSPGTVFNPLQNDDEKKDWVAIQPLATPDFAEMRWLNNNIQLGTVNYLKKLKKDVEIRLNVGYIYDYQQQSGSSESTYYTPSDTVHFSEKNYNQLYIQSLETRLTLQKNSSKKYFKNELAVKGNWDNQRGTILLNGQPVNQQLKNPFFWLTNKFTTIFRVNKTLLTLQSNTTANRIPQSLAVSPYLYPDLINGNNTYRTINQRVLAATFTTNNSVSLTKLLGHFTLLPELGLTLQKQKLSSYFDKDEKLIPNEEFRNELNWFRLNAFLTLKTQYRKDSWRLDFDSPLNYYQFRIQDGVASKNQKLSRLVLEPRFNINYTINAFWSVNSSIGYRNIFGEISDVHYGYLLRTYRTLQRRDVPLQNNQTISGAFGLNYRNPLTSVFGTLFYTSSRSRNNLLYRSHLAANGALDYSAVNQPNDSRIQLITGEISKHFLMAKTSVNTRLNWSTAVSDQLVNGALVTITNETISPGMSVVTNFSKILDVAYAYNLSLFKTQLSTEIWQRAYRHEHSLRTNLYLNQTNYLSIENEYYVNNLIMGSVKNFFTNLLFHYAIPKRKIELETRWTNVWNTRSLTSVSLSSFSYVESTFELRPMQIVQKAKFSF